MNWLERKPEPEGQCSEPAPWVHTERLWWRFLDSHGLGDDRQISLNDFSAYLSRSGFQIGRKEHRSAVLGVLQIPPRATEHQPVKPQCSKLPASWFALRTNCKLPNPDN